MRFAPAFLQPSTTASPTAPRPHTAQVDPFSTCWIIYYLNTCMQLWSKYWWIVNFSIVIVYNLPFCMYMYIPKYNSQCIDIYKQASFFIYKIPATISIWFADLIHLCQLHLPHKKECVHTFQTHIHTNEYLCSIQSCSIASRYATSKQTNSIQRCLWINLPGMITYRIRYADIYFLKSLLHVTAMSCSC